MTQFLSSSRDKPAFVTPLLKWIPVCTGVVVSLSSAAAFAAAEQMAEHGADAAHESGGLPQFDPSSFSSQIFWLAIAFAIMYLTFSRKTLPSISSVLENRREQVKGDRDTAEDMKNQAENVLKSYEEALENAQRQSAALSHGAMEDGKKHIESALAVFQVRADEQIDALESRLDNGKHQAMDDMNLIAAEIASAAAEKIAGLSTDIGQVKSVVQSLSKLSKAA